MRICCWGRGNQHAQLKPNLEPMWGISSQEGEVFAYRDIPGRYMRTAKRIAGCLVIEDPVGRSYDVSLYDE